ncbi:unnamed protein product [Victoria cruziana]
MADLQNEMADLGLGTPRPLLGMSASFKGESRSKKKGQHLRSRSGAEELINLLHGSDPVKLELNRLENEVRDKDRELGEAQAEVKALKLSERLKEKAVEELRDELKKVGERLKTTEALIENKNLEIKKLNDEKKEALAAQFAAEATLRRVHAAQKDDDMPPIEAIITPLEAELKLVRLEAAKLQDDNRALDRVTKSKEAALLDAERTVELALAKASLVDDLQNKNQELMKRIEICQEEHKIMDKLHRQKVAEVEKLTQTVRMLEESVLAGGAAANTVRDYQRKVQEMNEEKRTLDRELARAKVTANRVAVVVANEWKDANDKVMPVKQWLEERRFMQGEMQQLRDKLAIVERTAKSQAQLKEKYLLRLKVLEESLRLSSHASNRPSIRESLGGAEKLSRTSSCFFSSRRTVTSDKSFATSNTGAAASRHAKDSSSSLGRGSRSLNRSKSVSYVTGSSSPVNKTDGIEDSEKHVTDDPAGRASETAKTDPTEYVSGLLYDTLQKEVIALRKAVHEKDQSLKDKDDAIEMLDKKVETLTKAMDVEAKKMRREVTAMEKEVAAIRAEKERNLRTRHLASSKGLVNRSQLVPGRSTRHP